MSPGPSPDRTGPRPPSTPSAVARSRTADCDDPTGRRRDDDPTGPRAAADRRSGPASGADATVRSAPPPGSASPARSTSAPGSGPGAGSTSTRRPSTSRAGDRAVTPVVAVVLLVGIALVGTVALVVAGGPAIEESQHHAEVDHAEDSLREFDERAGRVAQRGGSERMRLGLARADGSIRRSDRGWMRVSVITDGTTTVVENRSLGALVYEDDGTAVAYQGGGVFRADGDRSVLLSAPDVGYTDGTLSVAMVSLSGAAAPGDRFGVAAGAAYPAFPERATTATPNVADDVTNPLDTAAVTVTVRSRFYRAWGEYFEATMPAGEVFYDHSERRVTVFLKSVQPPVGTAGIIATAKSGDLDLAGTGAYVDSYDSSAGTYSATSSAGGTVRAAGDLFVDGDATLLGHVEAGSEVTLAGNAQVDGDIGWTDDYDDSGDATVTGSVREIDGVESLDPVGGVVRGTVDRLARRNDNAATTVVENEALSISGSTAELGPGSYYVEELDLRGKRLVLNATGGDVEIGVENWVRLVRETGSDAEIEVKGDGDVRIYVAARDRVTVSPTGLGSRQVHFHVGKGSSVRVPNHDASRLLVVGPGEFDATVAGSSGGQVTFDGVVYAPAGTTGTGSVYVKQGDVYGAVVTGDLTLGQYGAVHFDRSVATQESQAGPSEIEYLHVVVRELILEE